MKRRPVKLLALGLALALAPRVIAHARLWLDDDTPSQSIGSTSSGRLLHGHPMPLSGAGFVTYSYLGASAGRQYVHGAVRDLLREAFAGCAAVRPDRRFVRRPVWWRHDEHVHVDFAPVVPR